MAVQANQRRDRGAAGRRATLLAVFSVRDFPIRLGAVYWVRRVEAMAVVTHRLDSQKGEP